MGKLFLIMGKSASGKDTLYKDITQRFADCLGTVVPYTTRPKRQGETEGVEYHFITESLMSRMKRDGKVIESRCYQTVYGPWYYLTVDDGQIDLSKRSSILIVTPAAYEKLRDYFGEDRVVPLYIEIDDGVRLERALKRERAQAEPKYEEMCRRFLADAKDFSEEVLNRLGIQKRFVNDDYQRVLDELCAEIEKECGDEVVS
ncbi:MAG: guanylate kinase [Lachnospiraceae bacterium]|nr:guanylate kinase [Lachnospiraceae bacterium]